MAMQNCRCDGEPQRNDSAELVESGRESCAEEDLKPSDLLPKTRGLLQKDLTYLQMR